MISIALLSDIHGNLPAFDAVAADIAQRRPDAVYVLGDMINGCRWATRRAAHRPHLGAAGDRGARRAGKDRRNQEKDVRRNGEGGARHLNGRTANLS